MFLYLWGATLLQLNIFAILAEHRKLNGGHLTTASITWASCLTWFAIEYMYHEHIHLYTYDIFAEKVNRWLSGPIDTLLTPLRLP
jgi:delta14-sterol reductase